MGRDKASDVRLPPGVRDFLPRATARRVEIARDILGRFELWGYQQIITPQFEVADVLERGLDAAAARSAIRFIEPGMGDVALLRPDITPQVARIAATRLDETGGPLRLCYEGTVIRAGRAARRQREIIQAGVELIGAPPGAGDAEIIALASEVLLSASRRAGASDCRLEVGHVGPVQALLAEVPDVDHRRALRRALSRRDLSAMSELTARLPDQLAAPLTVLPRLSGPLSEVRERAGDTHPEISSALSEIESILGGAAELAPKAFSSVDVVVDLGEVGAFPYYTGARVAGWLSGAGDAVLVGGRYDKLVARFGRDREATGFAVNIEALAEAHLEAGVPGRAGDGVLIVGKAPRSSVLAATLRRLGVRATVELGGLRGKKNPLRYATAAGFAAVLFVGDSGAELHVGRDKMKIPETVVSGSLKGDRKAQRRLRTAVRTDNGSVSLQGRKS